MRTPSFQSRGEFDAFTASCFDNLASFMVLFTVLGTDLVHIPNFGELSGSEDRGGGDNSIQFINFGRVGDKSFK